MLEVALPLQDVQLTRASYHALLLRFWGFYAPLEERLLGGPGHAHLPFDYRERAKAPKLQDDLYDMGHSPEMLLRAPQCDDLPSISTLPQILGCLYVIEGATLGGQIIARQLRVNLGLTPDVGARFFNGYGADTGSRWKETTACLTTMAATLNQDDVIVAGANATFQSLGRWVANSCSVQ